MTNCLYAAKLAGENGSFFVDFLLFAVANHQGFFRGIYSVSKFAFLSFHNMRSCPFFGNFRHETYLLSLFLVLSGWDFNILVLEHAGVNLLWPFMVLSRFMIYGCWNFGPYFCQLVPYWHDLWPKYEINLAMYHKCWGVASGLILMSCLFFWWLKASLQSLFLVLSSWDFNLCQSLGQ